MDLNLLYYSPRRGITAGNATRGSGLQPFYQTLQKALALQEGASEVSVRTAFDAVAFMRRCVRLRALTLAQTPYVITKGSTTLFDSDDRRDLPKDLAYLKGFTSILQQHEMDLALFGWSFALEETGQPVTAPGQMNKPPAALSWLRADAMSIEREDIVNGGVLKSYTRRIVTADGVQRDQRIPIERLIVIRQPTPFAEMNRGASDADAARGAAGAMHRYTEFIEGHLGGGLLKDVLFSVGDPSGQGRIPKDTTSAENKLTRWLQRRKKGDKQAQIVSELLNVHQLGEGLAGLTNEHLIEGLRQDIAAAFGVPYSLLQSAAANYATKQADKLDLYEYQLFGDMDLIEEAYNTQLLARFGCQLRFATERLEALQFAEAQKAQALQALTGGAAILSADEARAQLGYTAPGGGDGQSARAADIVLQRGF